MLPKSFLTKFFLNKPVGVEAYIACADGTKIRTVSAGEGQAIVLAHGFGGMLKS